MKIKYSALILFCLLGITGSSVFAVDVDYIFGDNTGPAAIAFEAFSTDVNGDSSGSYLQDGVTITATAGGTASGDEFNGTSSAFGINSDGSGDETAKFDGANGNEFMVFSFDMDGYLTLIEFNGVGYSDDTDMEYATISFDGGLTTNLTSEANGLGYGVLGASDIYTCPGEGLAFSAGQQITLTYGENGANNGWELAQISISTADAVSNLPPAIESIEEQSATEGENLTFNVVAYDATDNDNVTLSASNLPSGAVFTQATGIGVTNTFTWNNASPAGIYTTTFYAVDNDGMVTEEVVITVNPDVNYVEYVFGDNSGAATIAFEAFSTDENGDSSGSYLQGGITITATAGGTVGGDVFNGTSGGFGINSDGTGDETDRFDSANGDEFMTFSFDTDGCITAIDFSGVSYDNDLTNEYIILSFDGGLTTNLTDGANGLGYGQLDSGDLYTCPGNGLAFTAGQQITLKYGQHGGGNGWELGTIRVEATGGTSTTSNGVPYSWLNTYYPGNSDYEALASSDSDGDGQTAEEEYIAGLNPTNASSVFSANNPAVENADDFNMRFYTVAGRRYAVQTRENLLNGNWVNVVTNIIGNNDWQSVTNANAGADRYYRVRVMLGN